MTFTEMPEQTTKAASIEKQLREEGLPTKEQVQTDYFAFDETYTIKLPDSRSVIECKTLNEGARRKYLSSVNRDVRIQKGTGDQILRLSLGEEKKALLEESFVGWNLVRGDGPVVFSKQNVAAFLDRANPTVIDMIEKEVRKHNPWIVADVTADDIRKQIAELQELLEVKEAEEAGKAD